MYTTALHLIYSEVGSSELLQRANFPGAIAVASLFFEKNNACGVELSHFTVTAIRYFGVSGGQRKKFARAFPSAHIGNNCSSHCFVLTLDDFLR